jgi:hypothetical protein
MHIKRKAEKHLENTDLSNAKNGKERAAKKADPGEGKSPGRRKITMSLLALHLHNLFIYDKISFVVNDNYC